MPACPTANRRPSTVSTSSVKFLISKQLWRVRIHQGNAHAAAGDCNHLAIRTNAEGIARILLVGDLLAADVGHADKVSVLDEPLILRIRKLHDDFRKEAMRYVLLGRIFSIRPPQHHRRVLSFLPIGLTLISKDRTYFELAKIRIVRSHIEYLRRLMGKIRLSRPLTDVNIQQIWQTFEYLLKNACLVLVLRQGFSPQTYCN